MATFGTSRGLDNIPTTTMTDTIIGLRTTEMMVTVRARMVMIADLAQETETAVITAVPTLGATFE